MKPVVKAKIDGAGEGNVTDAQVVFDLELEFLLVFGNKLDQAIRIGGGGDCFEVFAAFDADVSLVEVGQKDDGKFETFGGVMGDDAHGVIVTFEAHDGCVGVIATAGGVGVAAEEIEKVVSETFGEETLAALDGAGEFGKMEQVGEDAFAVWAPEQGLGNVELVEKAQPGDADGGAFAPLLAQLAGGGVQILPFGGCGVLELVGGQTKEGTGKEVIETRLSRVQAGFEENEEVACFGALGDDPAVSED